MGWRRFCASALFACTSGYGSFEDQQTCVNTAPAGAHVRGAYSWDGECVLQCVQGFFDCNLTFADGCEVQGPCPKPPPPPPPPPPVDQLRLLTDLENVPNGVAVCNAHVYYLDGSNVMVADPNVQGVASSIGSSPTVPTGGLVCDGTYLYWPAAGAVIRFTIADASQTTVVGGVDPGRGIDMRGSSIYWIARTGFGDAGAMLVASDDAGSTSRLPITEAKAYKSFALTPTDDFAIRGTEVNAVGDGGTSTYTFGTPPEALVAGAGVVTPFAFTSTGMLVPANDPSTPIVNGVPNVVATASSGDTIVFASDSTVYAVHVTKKSLHALDGPFLHVSDVATDGAHAFFLTRGEGAEKAALWKTPVPP